MSGDTHPLDIGLVAYGNAPGLKRAIDSIQRCTHTEYQIHVVINPHPDLERHRAVCSLLTLRRAANVFVHVSPTNVGYAGGVNYFLQLARTPYVAYFDHDAWVHTDNWNVLMGNVLNQFHEVGIVFPNGGPYPIERGGYTEILWGVGCMWMMRRPLVQEVGLLDTEIGHHEEVDFQTRIRLAGYKIAALRNVGVGHEATASSDPAAAERISAGVRRWVDKWCVYFGGRHLNYHSANVLRHEDWPPSALYLEEYWKEKLPGLNATPEEISIDGAEYDLIRVPRLRGFYRHRVI